MAVIGVVCEYNPFHLGHQRHLEKSRAALGEETTVLCVMSGDYVQRGQAAVYDKFARAEAACRCGADLVAELPLPWSLSSAEGFARGAVSLLAGLGADCLSFGSETGALPPLERLAEVLAEPALTERIKSLLREEGSLSFAAAREQAVRERLGEEALLLRQPNNILAVEYLKAIRSLHAALRPLPILREGAAHDGRSVGTGPCSASELRARLAAGESLAGAVPAEAEAVFARERALGRELSSPDALEQAMLARLRMLQERDFERLPDGGEGLGRRLWTAVNRECGLAEILAGAQTKRYPLARLRRMCLCACLGIREGMNESTPPYARILAMTARGRAYLHERGKDAALPLLIRPGAVRELSGDCEALFALGARAHDFYALGRSRGEERRPGEDWRTGPRIIK